MNSLHILNVGRADANVLFFQTREGRKTVVIDGGGTAFCGRPVLLNFLIRHHVETIDLLILTHLHQDHFGGFYQLIDRIGVKRVIAPCGNLVFPESVYRYYAEKEFFREYRAAFSYFERIGARMETSLDCAGRQFTFGDSTLYCLYPRRDSVLHSVESARSLTNPSILPGQMNRACEAFKQACNEDSSIWAVRCADRDVALLAGDSTLDTMRVALEGFPFRPELLKLSHHGINLRYFSPEQVAKIHPKTVVISNSKEYDKAIRNECEGLCAPIGAQLRFTFDGTVSVRF